MTGSLDTPTTPPVPRVVLIYGVLGLVPFLAPPLVGALGVGYCIYYRRAESVGLDLRAPAGVAALRQLASRPDVLIESFRPSTTAAPSRCPRTTATSRAW